MFKKRVSIILISTLVSAFAWGGNRLVVQSDYHLNPDSFINYLTAQPTLSDDEIVKKFMNESVDNLTHSDVAFRNLMSNMGGALDGASSIDFVMNGDPFDRKPFEALLPDQRERAVRIVGTLIKAQVNEAALAKGIPLEKVTMRATLGDHEIYKVAGTWNGKTAFKALAQNDRLTNNDGPLTNSRGEATLRRPLHVPESKVGNVADQLLGTKEELSKLLGKGKITQEIFDELAAKIDDVVSRPNDIFRWDSDLAKALVAKVKDGDDLLPSPNPPVHIKSVNAVKLRRNGIKVPNELAASGDDNLQINAQRGHLLKGWQEAGFETPPIEEASPYKTWVIQTQDGKRVGLRHVQYADSDLIIFKNEFRGLASELGITVDENGYARRSQIPAETMQRLQDHPDVKLAFSAAVSGDDTSLYPFQALQDPLEFAYSQNAQITKGVAADGTVQTWNPTIPRVGEATPEDIDFLITSDTHNPSCNMASRLGSAAVAGLLRVMPGIASPIPSCNTGTSSATAKGPARHNAFMVMDTDDMQPRHFRLHTENARPMFTIPKSLTDKALIESSMMVSPYDIDSDHSFKEGETEYLKPERASNVQRLENRIKAAMALATRTGEDPDAAILKILQETDDPRLPGGKMAPSSRSIVENLLKTCK